MTRRQPKGIPTGGEFAANEHDEAAESLDDFDQTEHVTHNFANTSEDGFLPSDANPPF